MSPPLALALTICLVCYLIRRDTTEGLRPSAAIWIPVLWLLISGSRQPSQWLGLRSGALNYGIYEGSSIDQVVYGALILAGIVVLARRQVQISQLSKNSWWILLFFLFEGLSCLWSDYTFISFRRWIKASGDFVMVFIILSDPNPAQAITATLRRTGYILVPFSLLFVKYYRDLGIVTDDWGRSYYTGVTLDKNMFGGLLFAFGLFFSAGLVHAIRQHASSLASRRHDIACYALLVAMVAWLTPLANSKTSLVAMLIGVVLMLALQLAAVRRHLWKIAIGTGLVTLVFNAFVPIMGAVAEASGRDATLTGRTGIWQTVLSESINPLIGTGYTAFWLGERLDRIWAKYPLTPLLQAHNGYIEVYINLGLVGLILLGGVLWTGLRNARRRLRAAHDPTETLDDSLFRTFGIAYILAYLLYNVTEATFCGFNFLFIIFLFLAFESQSKGVLADGSDLKHRSANPAVQSSDQIR